MYKRLVPTLFFTILLVNFCQSQRILNESMTPNVEAKISSWYPDATNIQVEYDTSKQTTEIVCLQCHCTESAYTIEITFDMNANVLGKNYFYLPINNLPLKVLKTMTDDSTLKRNLTWIKGRGYPDSMMAKFTINDTIYIASYMRELINNKVSVNYMIYIGTTDNKKSYIWKYKSTGELISKNEIHPFVKL